MSKKPSSIPHRKHSEQERVQNKAHRLEGIVRNKGIKPLPKERRTDNHVAQSDYKLM